MNTRRGLLILGIPAAALLALGGLLLFRERGGSGTPPAQRRAELPPPAPRPAESYRPAPPPALAPRPAAEDAIAKATDDARVLSTYQNYRTAVATDNRGLQDALRPIMLRDRELGLRLAQKELNEASSDGDREIARKTLESLRR